MDGGGLIIRRARKDEWLTCAALYEAVLRETFTWMDPSRHRAQDFLDAARSEEVYVALDAGRAADRVVGLASFYRPQSFIHSLYVAERGRGIGKALLDHLDGVSDGPLSLKVQSPNVRAQAFYTREGFRPVEFGRDHDISWIRLARGGGSIG